MLTHLEAYEIGLVAWVALLAVWGLQGLIAAYVEDPRPTVAERRPVKESWSALLLILALIALEIFWAILFVRGIFAGASAKTLALYGALLAFTLAAALIVYRRAFVPDETLLQERDEEAPW